MPPQYNGTCRPIRLARRADRRTYLAELYRHLTDSRRKDTASP